VGVLLKGWDRKAVEGKEGVRPLPWEEKRKVGTYDHSLGDMA